VSQDVDMSAARDMAAVMRVAEAIAASLKHNELDVDEGFRAFDEDEDDLLSLQDLVKSAVTLQVPQASLDSQTESLNSQLREPKPAARPPARPPVWPPPKRPPNE